MHLVVLRRYDELVAVTREMEAQGITENSHTELTIESLRAEWNAISVLATEKAKALAKELGTQRASNLSDEQVQEYRDCFQHFDKDRDSQLSRIELFGCMRACGYEYPLVCFSLSNTAWS
jgi:actinin alpha